MAKKTTKPKEPAKKRGRPSAFSKEIQRQAMILAAKGFTDTEMSQVFNVKEQTFNNWKKAHPDFFESLKNEKSKADAQVVRALYERACGYNFIDDDGKTKQFPPDPVSMIFWLKNRDKENWRDKQEHGHTVTLPPGLSVSFISPKNKK